MARKRLLRKAFQIIRRFTRQFGPAGLTMAFNFLPLELELGAGTVALTLPGSPHPIHLRKGTTDKDVFFQIFLIREYDFSGSAQFERLKADYDEARSRGEKPLIIDAGANIGLAARWFANIFPEVRIYALEPDEGNYAMLCANTKGFPNIVALRAALWDKSAAKLAITNQAVPASFYSVTETGGAGESGIPAHTVPDIMRMADTRHLLLAKIDIEGGESALFRSNTAWLGDTDAVAIELHDWLLPGTGSSRNFIAALAQYPFEILWRHGTMFCVKLPGQPKAAKKAAE